MRIILLFHILGAFTMAALMISAVIFILQNKTERLETLAKNISYGLGFQLVTGSLLVFADVTRGSIISFCSKIGLYILIVAGVETLLFYKMKKLNFPLSTVLGSSAVGMSFAIITLALLL